MHPSCLTRYMLLVSKACSGVWRKWNDSVSVCMWSIGIQCCHLIDAIGNTGDGCSCLRDRPWWVPSIPFLLSTAARQLEQDTRPHLTCSSSQQQSPTTVFIFTVFHDKQTEITHKLTVSGLLSAENVCDDEHGGSKTGQRAEMRMHCRMAKVQWSNQRFCRIHQPTLLRAIRSNVQTVGNRRIHVYLDFNSMFHLMNLHPLIALCHM